MPKRAPDNVALLPPGRKTGEPLSPFALVPEATFWQTIVMLVLLTLTSTQVFVKRANVQPVVRPLLAMTDPAAGDAIRKLGTGSRGRVELMVSEPGTPNGQLTGLAICPPCERDDEVYAAKTASDRRQRRPAGHGEPVK